MIPYDAVFQSPIPSFINLHLSLPPFNFPESVIQILWLYLVDHVNHQECSAPDSSDWLQWHVPSASPMAPKGSVIPLEVSRKTYLQCEDFKWIIYSHGSARSRDEWVAVDHGVNLDENPIRRVPSWSHACVSGRLKDIRSSWIAPRHCYNSMIPWICDSRESLIFYWQPAIIGNNGP